MKKENTKNLCIAVSIITAFVIWTVLVRIIDARSIGPQGTTVGFAAINRYIHSFTGVNMSLYIITDWLSLIPLLFIVGFAALGLVQWIKRKQLRYVDLNLILLGGFYIVVLAVYFLFEVIAVNYRPVLINGFLEASYPSSTTMLVLCVIPTAIMQFNIRIKNKLCKLCITSVLTAFAVFMVIGRFISGVHWFTDIIGGILLSAGLVMLYYTFLPTNKAT